MTNQLIFSMKNFRGIITWPRIMHTYQNPKRKDGLKNKDHEQLFSFHHACHEEDLRNYLRHGFIGMNSVITFDIPDHGTCPVNGIWFSSLEWERNFFGPFVLSLSSWIFTGRTFMVFAEETPDRENNMRTNYQFIQHDIGLPIYGISPEKWQECEINEVFDIEEIPVEYVDEEVYDTCFCPKEFTSYYVVLTSPISTKGMELRVAEHPRCELRKCNSNISKDQAKESLLRILSEEKDNSIKVSPIDDEHSIFSLNGAIPILHVNYQGKTSFRYDYRDPE